MAAESAAMKRFQTDYAVHPIQPNEICASGMVFPHSLHIYTSKLPPFLNLRLRRNLLPRLLTTHLEHNLLHLPRLEVLVRLRRLLQRHRLATQEGHLLLLLHEDLEGVFEDATDGAAAKRHRHVLAVQHEAVDFPLFGAEAVGQKIVWDKVKCLGEAYCTPILLI